MITLPLKKTQILLICAAASVLLATGCSPTIAQRGNLLADYQLQEVTPGTSSKSDVLRALGSPTTQSTFDENVWYYLGQETAKKGILDPKITKERIVVVNFDATTGLVSSIKDASPERLDIPLARSKTTTHGNDITIMQQLLGNIGKFNKQEAPR
jgi:outer membrane protein assembly factor BamE (lipoprotein component of BamABCDE complex)